MNSDFMFKDAEVFFKNIGRKSVDVEKVVSEIVAQFVDADVDEVKSDFHAMVDPLIEGGYVLCGETEGEIEAQEKTDFS